MNADCQDFKYKELTEQVRVFDHFEFYSQGELTLSDDEIHVWRAFLHEVEPHLHALAQTISADERHKAERFYFERDRKRFVSSHGILRKILGRYLRLEPNRLKFLYGSHGKPTLGGTTDGHSICFNMSDSNGLALFAFTRGREVGVDVEYIRPMHDSESIAERLFSPKENAALRAVPPSKKLEAFFNCWTRKEAFLKATGDGLARPLDEFEVSLAMGEQAGLLSIEGDLLEASRWRLVGLAPAPGYVGALVVEYKGRHPFADNVPKV